MLYDSELNRAKHRFNALLWQGSYADAEALARELVECHAEEDVRRVESLLCLAEAQSRQDLLEEALETSLQAVRLAHRCGDIDALVTALQVRAQIRCFDGDYPGAIRALQEAQKFLQFGGVDNQPMQARLAQTWAYAYAGCGWWEPAAQALREAAQFYESEREWNDWALVVGDLTLLALNQAEAEGPDPDLLEELRPLLRRAQVQVGPNQTFRLQTTVAELVIRKHLACSRRDWATLGQIRQESGIMMRQFGEPGSLCEEPQNVPAALGLAINTTRIDRILADSGCIDDFQVQRLLTAQDRYLTMELESAPRILELWQERAALHLCMARHAIEQPASAVRGALTCLETATDGLGVLVETYADPQARAGFLGKWGRLLEGLASSAAFALNEVSPPQREVALRLIGLIQLLRVRARGELVRSLESLRPPAEADRAAVTELLARVRTLHRWLERLDAEGHAEAESPIRPMKKVSPKTIEGTLIVSLGRVAAESDEAYPDYRHLRNRGQVETELSRCKARLEQFAKQNVAVRSRALQLGQEGPFDLERWRQGLAQDEAALDYCLGPSGGHVVLLGRDHVQMYRLPAGGIRPLRRLMQTHLSPEEFPAGEARNECLTRLAEGMQRCAGWLLPREMVDRLTKMAARRLYIVASGPLWRVPFAWLRAGDQLVFQRWEVVLVPSLRLAGRVPVPTTPLSSVAVGHPGTPFLKNVEHETSSVASLLGCRELFEKDATPSRVLAEVFPEMDLIHFCCHGEADAIAPWLSSLRLEPDEQHRDGRLMLFEVLGIPIRALVINTAACFTARTEGPLSFPESLAHAFLGAGARFVVASLWAANDRECLRFARDFYGTFQKQGDVPGAFRLAQLRQCERIGPVGDGSGAAPTSGEDLYRCANFVLLGASQEEPGLRRPGPGRRGSAPGRTV